MKKDWLWDKDISEKELKGIFSDRDNPRFISLSALLLSRKNSAEEVFKEYIKREDFFIRWQSIKRRMRKNSWNDPRIEYWQAIYETLKKIPEVAELKQPKSSVLKIQEEPLFALPREIGGKIKEIREKLGLTQRKLSEKLGVSQQIISRIESGKQNISLGTLDNICRKLGIFLTAEKLGFAKEYPIVTSTRHILPFNRLAPNRFEDLCLWIIQRSKEFDKVEKYGGIGDKQRDIVAYKYNIVGKCEKWYFQCKRYAEISFSVFEKELNKIKEYAGKDNDFKPDRIVFVTGCPVSPGCKDRVEKYAKTLSCEGVEFWDDVKLDEKTNATDGAVEEFFRGGISEKKIAEKVVEEVKIQLLEHMPQYIFLEADSIRTDGINKEIDEAVKLININNIEAAKDSLFKILGKLEVDKKKYKNELVRVYNNLGVCFSRLEGEKGSLDKAKEYFESALKINPNFNKAKANLSSVYLNIGGKDNFKKAYDIADKLWNESDKKDPLFCRVFIWSLVYNQSPQSAVEYYESSLEAKVLAVNNEQLLNLIGSLYLEIQNFGKANESVDLALGLSPNSADSLVLKAKVLMLCSQRDKIIPAVFEVVPKFQDYEDIEKSLKMFEQALGIAKGENKHFFVNQIKMDIDTCSAWLNRACEAKYKAIRESIDISRLTKFQIQQLNIQDSIIGLKKRNFESAYDKLISELARMAYREKLKIAHIFLLEGAPEQSKNLLKMLESEAEQKKDIQFWIDMSLDEVLLGDKNLAIKAAEKARDFSIGTDKEKIALSHFNAIMMRYAFQGEVDRLMKGVSDYDKRYPEDKIVKPVKAVDEEGRLTEEIKSIFTEKKEWWNGVKQMFRQEPVISYFIERILKRPYVEFLSFQNDPEFIIELTIPNAQFEQELFDNLQKAETLVFDYASLLNLSKMNLLGYLERFDKQLYITKELFDKVQYELLMFEQEDLRRLWSFLRSSKEIEIVEEFKAVLKGENVDKLFDKWLVDSMRLAKDKNAVFVVDDFRLLKFLYSEDIKGCNSYIILKAMRAKEWIDDKMYSLSIGDLAERFYTFLPFSGNDLFQIVMEDKSRISLRSYHLINQLFLPGSNAESFIKVSVKFIDLLWITGSLPEDKIKWLGFLSEKILEFIDKQGGADNNQEFEKLTPDFVQMWIIAVQRSNRDEIVLLEKGVNKILTKPYLSIFKDNIAGFIQAKKQKLISG